MTTTTVDYEQLLLRLGVAKLRILDDLEVQLRSLGQKSLSAGEEIPEWIFTELDYVIQKQTDLRGREESQ